jgi:hypothetical protein
MRMSGTRVPLLPGVDRAIALAIVVMGIVLPIAVFGSAEK